MGAKALSSVSAVLCYLYQVCIYRLCAAIPSSVQCSPFNLYNNCLFRRSIVTVFETVTCGEVRREEKANGLQTSRSHSEVCFFFYEALYMPSSSLSGQFSVGLLNQGKVKTLNWNSQITLDSRTWERVCDSNNWQAIMSHIIHPKCVSGYDVILRAHTHKQLLSVFMFMNQDLLGASHGI